MLAIFGYMDSLIIVKWLTEWRDTAISPSIITYMIEMFLNMGSISGQHLILTKSLNEWVHVLLLIVAFVCIPSMLMIKPYLLNQDIQNLVKRKIVQTKKKIRPRSPFFTRWLHACANLSAV